MTFYRKWRAIYLYNIQGSEENCFGQSQIEFPAGDAGHADSEDAGRAAMHGWGISERIEQVSAGVLRVYRGSFYPALYRLEQQGVISAE